jgi:hypothetical protein
MEHRVKKPVYYKVLNIKGKVDDVFNISTEIRYDNVTFIPLVLQLELGNDHLT